MPTVPTYGGAQVQARALQTPMQGQVDVSSGLQAGARALEQVAGIADAKALRDAEAEANKADSDITAAWLNWDAENRRKYQGQNADQYAAEAEAWWKKAAGEYGKGLSPMAQRRISEVMPRKQNQAMASVLSAVSAEKERFADQSAEAAAQTSIEFGIDTGNVAGARNEVRTITAQQGARKGWTTEQVQAEQQRRLATLHLAYITRIAESDPEKATVYFEANKTEIPATAQVKIEGVLKAEGDNRFALQFAASNAGKPLDEQLRMAGDIADPVRREKAIQQVKVNQGLVRAAQQEREQAAADQAWQMVGQGKKVPESVLGVMDGRSRVQLQDYLRQRAEHFAAQGTKPVKTDPLALAAVYDMMRDNPDEFKTLRMESLAFKLAGSDLEQVARIQRDMRSPSAEKDIVSLSAQLGPYTDTMNKADKALFESKAFQQVIEFQQANKRPPNSQERQQLLDGLAMEVVTHKGMLWDSKSPRYKLTAEQAAKTAGPPVQVKTADDYNKLPKGTTYVAPDGTTRTKQ